MIFDKYKMVKVVCHYLYRAHVRHLTHMAMCVCGCCLTTLVHFVVNGLTWLYNQSNNLRSDSTPLISN